MTIARAIALTAVFAVAIAAPVVAGTREWHDAGTFGVLDLAQPPSCIVQARTPRDAACQLPPISTEMPEAQRIEALRQRVVMHAWLRQMDSARQELDAALGAAPKTAALWHLRARVNLQDAIVFGQNKRLLDALRDADEAVALDATAPDFALTRSVALLRTGKSDEALAIAVEVTERHGGNAKAWLWRGQLEMAAPAAAIRSLEKAVALDPVLIDAKRNLGVLHLYNANPVRSVELLNQVIEAEPFQVMDYDWRSKANMVLGRLEAAASDLSAIIDGPVPGARFALSKQQQAETLLARAMVRAALEQHEGAADDLVRAAVTGGKQQVLRIQLMLKRKGVAVTIDGEANDALKQAIRGCIADPGCRASLTSASRT